MVGPIAVSYTHLDVYKRQVENYQKHVKERELWLKKLYDMKEKYHKIYGDSADDVEDLSLIHIFPT